MKINEFEIENIIFDLGGVILNIDTIGVIERFEHLGIFPFQNSSGNIEESSIFKTYEIGQISTTDFRNEFRRISQSEFSNDEFDRIWNSIILNFPKDNILIIEKLKTEHRTFLMSNTNELHCNYFNNLLDKNYPYQNLNQLFEKVYYSHVINMRKPETRFYQFLLNENNIKPENTVFVDDLKENIDAAAALGIHTIHIKKGSVLKDYFEY